MTDAANHIIRSDQSMKAALKMLNDLGEDLTLFVVNKEEQLIGTVTDGDVRRGLLDGLAITDDIQKFMKASFNYIRNHDYDIKDILNAKEKLLQILPVLDPDMHILKLINFSKFHSWLPIDAVIMAGGEGIRLRPLTENIPKPMLKIGNKPILEHVIDWLHKFGIENMFITTNYLGEKIKTYFKDGSDKHISISYIDEVKKLGTIGSVSMIENFKNDYILVINSDLLTNIDLEKFFFDFQKQGADMSIATIPYNVNIPYAILDTDGENVLGLKEKPSITYHSNAGIYLIKRKHISRIPHDTFYNATDLINEMVENNLKVTYHPVLDYWLDIGKMDDFRKAENDIKYIKF